MRKAKEKLAPIGHLGSRLDNVEETDRRILQQKQEFEVLYRQYQQELVHKRGVQNNPCVKEKKVARDERIQAIREKKFSEELASHQKSLNYKRNAQQVKLCQKVYKLASELEKGKLLQEKKMYRETQ